MASCVRRSFSTLRALRTTMDTSALPASFLPPVNRDMKVLDRSFFRKVVPISAATLLDAKQTTTVRNALSASQELFKVGGLKPIVDDETEPGAKCLLLKPEVNVNRPEEWSSQLSKLVDENSVRVRPFDLTLTYDNWSMHDILEAILPELPEDQKETPGGFAQAGHIAHINLRSQYLPYKHLIGQILLDKNPQLRTVINKTLDVGSESQFRTFPYEVLAGDNDLEVTASEQGCEFRFNFAEVYWNSRLSSEHERIVTKFKPGEAVCDVMAGVGPFAIPAGKRKVFVRANDLNPHSSAGLQWAIQRNKVSNYVVASCVDGRDFIRSETANLAKNPRSFTFVPNIKISRNASPTDIAEVMRKRDEQTATITEPTIFDHYVMNLPALAVEFLDAFKGVLQDRESEFSSRKLPMIHVYTFQARCNTPEDEVKEVCKKVSHFLGAEVNPEDSDCEIYQVRLVAPNKWFYCASFRLPAEVAFGSAPSTTETDRA